jgi:hypothetical protein
MKNFNAHQLGGRRCRKEQHVFFRLQIRLLLICWKFCTKYTLIIKNKMHHHGHTLKQLFKKITLIFENRTEKTYKRYVLWVPLYSLNKPMQCTFFPPITRSLYCTVFSCVVQLATRMLTWRNQSVEDSVLLPSHSHSSFPPHPFHPLPIPYTFPSNPSNLPFSIVSL